MRTLVDVKQMALKEPNDQLLGGMVRAFVMQDIPSQHRICIKCGRWQSDLNHQCEFCGYPFNKMNHED